MGEKLPEKKPAAGAVDAFLQKLAAMPTVRPVGPRGRLIFALDATASRQPSWDQACLIQAQMFAAVGQMGGLDIQLVYYRGFHDFEAFPWLDNAAELTRRMTGVVCLGGHTQIGRVLKHAIAETRAKRVNALVFVGDCMEESADTLCHLAGQLGVLGLPVFLFHEGHEPIAAATFKQMAKLSGGAYCPFDAGSAQQLTELLRAVAVYAAGGLKALQDLGQRAGGKTLLLTRQLGAK
jgi:hypothetical protein